MAIRMDSRLITELENDPLILKFSGSQAPASRDWKLELPSLHSQVELGNKYKDCLFEDNG